MTHGKTIAKNAAWLMVATTGQKIISFLTFIFVARLVGVSVTGEYFYAVSVTSIFVGFADLGLTPVVIRELAAHKERGLSLLKRALEIKAILVPLSVLGALAYVYSTSARADILLAVALACFVLSADAFSLLWYGTLRGRQQLKYEAWGMLIGQCMTAVVSLSLAALGWGVFGLILGLMAGSFWNLGWSVLRSRAIGLWPRTDSAWPLQRVAWLALPFALAGIFNRVYSYTDTLLLQAFHGTIAVGLYAVAYKLTYALQFLPLTFVAALYPGMSAVHASGDKKKLEYILQGSMRLMMLLGVPISAGLSALAPALIPLLYGKSFIGSVAPLLVLPWVLIPIFLDFPIGSLLNATGRASQKTLAMGIAMVINVTANLFFVPMLGPSGAALAAIVSFWTLFFIGVWFIRKDVDLVWLVRLFFRGMIAAGVLWAVFYWLVGHTSLLLTFMGGVVAGSFLLFLAGLVRLEDARIVVDWFRRHSVHGTGFEKTDDVPPV